MGHKFWQYFIGCHISVPFLFDRIDSWPVQRKQAGVCLAKFKGGSFFSPFAY